MPGECPELLTGPSERIGQLAPGHATFRAQHGQTVVNDLAGRAVGAQQGENLTRSSGEGHPGTS